MTTIAARSCAHITARANGLRRSIGVKQRNIGACGIARITGPDLWFPGHPFTRHILPDRLQSRTCPAAPKRALGRRASSPRSTITGDANFMAGLAPAHGRRKASGRRQKTGASVQSSRRLPIRSNEPHGLLRKPKVQRAIKILGWRGERTP